MSSALRLFSLSRRLNNRSTSNYWKLNLVKPQKRFQNLGTHLLQSNAPILGKFLKVLHLTVS